MKRIKRVILSLLLSKNERVTLWNSLWFSNHTYRRRGNVDGAVAVQIVMNNLENVLGVPKDRKYSEKVVSDKAVAEFVDGIVKAFAEANEHVIRDISRHEFNKDYQKGRSERTIEGEDTEKEEKNEEQAPKSSAPVSEAERLRAEDDGVNYEKESSDSQ